MADNGEVVLRGRPTKCTPEVIERFGAYMAAGLYAEEAADLVGITPMTARRWLQWGEAALDAAGNDLDKVPPEKRAYANFCAVVRAKAAAAVARNVALIQEAATTNREGDWRAAAWFLEHRRPETWGRREVRQELSGRDGEPLAVKLTLVPIHGPDDPLAQPWTGQDTEGEEEAAET